MPRFYDLPGTENVSDDPYFTDPVLCPDFLDKYNHFKNELSKEMRGNTAVSYIHFGDGDYFFLTKQSVGSATPGYRAISLPYNEMDMTPHLEGILKNDHVSVELSPTMRARFREVFPGKDPDIPTEFIYGSVANKWFFKEFKGKIGLIGAYEKIKIVRELMSYPSYQQYLGIDRFEDYVTIPQKFAADDVDRTEKMLSEQIASARSRLFLFGVGHVKNALAHRLRKHRNAVYVDVGGGIDMLAGIIDYERPYAAGWINHRIRGYDYSGVDFMYFKERPTDRWLPNG